MKKIKNIAIITFNNKKTDLIEWSYFNKAILMPHQIIAIGFAANILEGTLNKKINQIEPGNFGGYRQLRNLITEGEIDAIIVFGDAAEIYETKDLKAVLETAIQQNILVAANRTTADFLLHSSLIDCDYLIADKEKKQTNTKEFLDETNLVSLAKAS